MQTCFGVLATKDGCGSGAGRYWSTPAGRYHEVQEQTILIDRDHDGRAVGEAVYLERDRKGRLWLVAHVDDHVLPVTGVRVGTELRHVATPLYWSASRIGDDVNGYVLTSVSLTVSPARVGARSRGEAVSFLPGELDCRSAPNRWNLDDRTRGLLLRAAEAVRFRNPGGALVIRDAATVALEGCTLERGAARQLLEPARRYGGPLRYSPPFKGITSVR